MFRGILSESTTSQGNLRIEEHSEGEEILSKTSSGDVTETEEHVTVHSKREPLPWSLRGPSYNKPLPGIAASPLPESFAMPPAMATSGPKSPRMSPRPGSPFAPVVESPPASPTTPRDTTTQQASPIPSPQIQSSPQPAVASPQIIPSSPRKSEVSFDAVILQPSPGAEASGEASFEENSPPISGRPLSGFDEEANMESAPFVAVPIPMTNNAPLLETTLTAASPAMDYAKSPVNFAPPMIEIHSPMSAAHERSPYVSPTEPTTKVEEEAAPQSNVSPLDLSAAPEASPIIPMVVPSSPAQSLSPKESPPASPAPSLSALEEGLSPTALAPSAGLGDKRIRSPSPSPLLQEQQNHVSKVAKVAHPKQGPPQGYSPLRDWQVYRKFRSEKFFFPQLFNAARLQYLHVPRKHKPVPREFRKVMEDVDPGARYRRDWQVERRYPVHRYYNPQLFDEGHLRRVKIPMTRNQKKRHFKERMAALGIVDFKSPAAMYRINWATSRRYPVEHFYEPQLFDSIIPASEKLRVDWYTLRRRNPVLFHNGFLHSLPYQTRRKEKDHFMVRRLMAHHPYKYPQRIKPLNVDPGQKYRTDWQVTREFPVYEFYEPSLFDEERALREATDWSLMIASYMLKYHGIITQAEAVRNAEAEEEERLQQEELERERAAEVRAKLLEKEMERQRVTEKEEEEKLAKLERQRLDEDERRRLAEVERQMYQKAKEAEERVIIRETEYFVPAPVEDDSTRPLIELIRALRGKYGNVDDGGNEYDWDFWEGLFRENSLDDESRETLLDHIRMPQYAQIPSELRPALWFLISGMGSSTSLQGEYELIRGIPSSYEQSISADVTRAMLVRGLSSEQASSLHSILSAYAQYDPEVGYCPALCDIAATLVMNINEEDAFTLLVQIMQVYDHRRYLQTSLGGTGPLEYQFEHLLLELDSELAMHLAHFEIDSTMYVKSFYATLGSGMGSEVHAQTLDMFLLEGYLAIHRLALLATVENREELLMCDHFVSLMEILTGSLSSAHHDWTARDWIIMSCTIVLSDEELVDLAQEYQIQAQILHEQQVLQDLSFIEGEHDNVLWQLRSLEQEFRRICLSREALASQLLEADHNTKVVLNDKYNASRRIHELEREIASQQQEYDVEVKRLTALLNAEDVREGALAPSQQVKNGDKIFKI